MDAAEAKFIRSMLREIKKNLILSNRLSSRLLDRKMSAVMQAIGADAPESLNYRQFEYTGPPRLAARLLREWALLVYDVLGYGPAEDAVTVKVEISTKRGH